MACSGHVYHSYGELGWRAQTSTDIIHNRLLVQEVYGGQYFRLTKSSAGTKPAALPRNLSGRTNDTVAPGYVRAVVNPRLIQSAENSNPSTGGLPPAEPVIELSYGAKVTKWLLIRPDLQYIPDPFRFAHERRALPFGVQVKVQF